MKNPYNPLPIMVLSIVSSGIGFMLLGIWVGDKIPHNDLLLVGVGIAYLIMAVGVSILYHEITRKQSSFDSGTTTPSSKY